MKVVITGGCGFLGTWLARRLLLSDGLEGPDDRPARIDKILLCDLQEPPTLRPDPRLEVRIGDFSTREALETVITDDVAVVFHLAAVVSGGAEQDFDLGMRVNLHGTLNLLECLRALGTRPRLVFASSLAVYGGVLPPVVTDQTGVTPQSSYGTQKAAAELLINDYSRKGFIDGRAIRLPMIVVRPGAANAALSGFGSAIIREPLEGRGYVCPVSPDAEVFILSPERVTDALVLAAKLPAAAWGSFRALALPGLTITVREMVEALRTVAGQAVVDRIEWRPDPAVERIVGTWPSRLEAARARELGFRPDDSIEHIIQMHMEHGQRNA